ncbi:hypothetical protein COW36_21055 [bacterium (Candidatus Blackallbacteria) CG17_big_fil_post_rev_8_21_14_2_50_48_46]|uniref:PhzF family phenazine biosynthesis protein n=1 Tax=bacterium (Candidatus Blackallbacteria) CG17_big_fil_post_rev_8_21_14_2_50_48_46 TaxID=2014261 RepID=A0A2M7FYT7_9BACT|nr:MAG: hypothetical protein COW64_14365 [bacterium (Candidatus Blackallbacteria) CG18_big_fil_WC_8_21_14_2_50_49_26]PIW14531.1 MAG: hypothetical protein COW36_21055 [bacterium (Candidatus Blackallbacteria) CG17_big_fil_post_rev_8_21_14_2_50_48_46]PIW47216.1 MAG: hypothetical protein COW20_13500 [bacterium (Candidatus Blackallbacteria) CG13_big_fil_rev_8_21_14_2_50_49_14]
MKDLSFYWLDVFSERLLGGNPLAVVFGAERLSSEQMQALAREFNLSETTFVLPPENPAHSCRVRIFTPQKELPFAGHPTLGAAWAVRKAWGLAADALILEEGVGPVPVRFLSDSLLEFEVAKAPDFAPLALSPEILAQGLGLAPEQIGWENFQPEIVSAGVPYALIPIRSLAAIRSARYLWGATDPLLKQFPILGEVYLVCPESEDPAADFHVRLFAPGAGVAEDPATGSAAAALGAWLQKHHPTQELWQLEQGLEMGRPSQLWIRLEQARIFVRGEVRCLAQGQLSL